MVILKSQLKRLVSQRPVQPIPWPRQSALPVPLPFHLDLESHLSDRLQLEAFYLRNVGSEKEPARFKQ